jgi:tetratricopeptide (TPR) repeat protein
MPGYKIMCRYGHLLTTSVKAIKQNAIYMKRQLHLSLMFLLSVSAAFSQGLTAPPSGDNQKSKVIQFIGPVEVSISYSSPDVHAPNGDDRTGKIWGEVAHFGFIDQQFGSSKAAPWRAGANENTVFTVSHDVKISGKELKAGSYGLFLAVSKEGPYTWIFSKNHTSWGSYFYDPKEDALRVEAMPEDAPYKEWLTYGFEDRLPSSATAYLRWEKKKIPLKIEVPNVNEIYVGIMREELRNAIGFRQDNWLAAARFCVQNKINLEEALQWVNMSVSNPFIGVENFNSRQTRSLVLAALGREAEANAEMEKAIQDPSASVGAIHQYGRSLLSAGKNDKAMEIFKYNAQKHPEEKFTPNVGLARGYTALGDKKNAIKYWELALKNIPENQKQFLPQYEAEVKKLKEGK